MSDTPDASSTPVGETSSNYTPKSYDIAPEDAALAESLVNLDPIRDLSGPFEVVGNVKLPTQITRDNLPPEVRAQVDARLSEVPVKDRTPQIESAIMRQEAENFAYFMRVLAGPGPNANAYQQEFFLVEHELYDAKRKFATLQDELQTVTEVRATFNPETGEETEVQTFLLNGDARTAAEHEVATLRSRIALLGPGGPERAKRLDRAKWEAVQEAKHLQEELAIDREAEVRAAEKVRNERIDERADALAKFKRTER